MLEATVSIEFVHSEQLETAVDLDPQKQSFCRSPHMSTGRKQPFWPLMRVRGRCHVTAWLGRGEESPRVADNDV